MDKDERVPPLHPEEPGPSPQTLRYYEQRAHEYIRLGLWTPAFKYYYAYFEHLTDQIETQLVSQVHFTKVASQMAQLYEGVDDDERVTKSLLQILNLFPQNAIVLNLLGVFLFKKGEFFIAKHYLQKATNLPIKYLPAEKNLLHVTWHQVPRWHYRMLNDKVLNQAYHEAITKAVNTNYTKVFDIGAGCGLLTLIATSANPATNVVAFEENKTLATIAERLIEQNNVKNRVVIHQQLSTTIKKKVERGNLVVTEMFDVGLFGGQALTTLLHALDRFIDDDDFKIIPSSARVYVTGVQSEQLSRRYRFIRKIPELKLENICIRSVETEPYDGQYLTNDNCKFITKTVMFLHVDFEDEFQLLSLVSEGDSLRTSDLEWLEDGCIDALVVWYDLNLDDDITISTNPNSDRKVKCWEQAVFYLSHPINLNKGETLTIKPEIIENHLNFSIESHISVCDQCFQVSKETLSLLNDQRLVRSLIRTSESFKFNNLTIVDYYCFPIFGLLMLKRGADVHHFYHNTIDLHLIRHVLTINDLDCSKFVSLHPSAGNDYLALRKDIGIVMSDLIHMDGSWYRQTLPDELILKYKPLILPKYVVVNARLVHSCNLDHFNRVDDDNCFNFGIAQQMNEYTGTEHPNFDKFDCKAMSNIVAFNVSQFTWDSLKQNAIIETSGICNGIFIWYHIRFIDNQDTAISTVHSTHYAQHCVILPNVKTVEKGDVITICLERDDTYMKIFCE